MFTPSSSANRFLRRCAQRVVGALALTVSALAVTAAQASVIYTFNPGPIVFGYDNQSSAAIGFTSDPPQSTSASASFTLTNALATNATTTLVAELGGFDLLGGPNTGGVEAFSAGGFAFPGITSNAASYTLRSDANSISVFRYSTLDGTVTTDATGNIVDWNLRFTLFEVNGTGEIWIGPGAPPPGFPPLFTTSVDMGTFLNSNPRLISQSVAVLDGVVGPATLNGTAYDEVFGDPGPVQLHRFTGVRGNWTSDAANPVPAPAAAWILALGVLALGGMRKRV
jgi:hypothetical protein